MAIAKSPAMFCFPPVFLCVLTHWFLTTFTVCGQETHGASPSTPVFSSFYSGCFSTGSFSVPVAPQRSTGAVTAVVGSVPGWTCESRRVRKLEELERKALAYDTAVAHIVLQESTLSTLREELVTVQAELAALREAMARLSAVTNELSLLLERRNRDLRELQNILSLIRFGRYEYYEVKPGDTCESIAAQPGIYNDPAKHVLIRQANRGSGLDLDRLLPGQVLIIPRIPLEDRHDP